MFRAVVFDMDGVILDSHPVHKMAWRRLLESRGRQVSDAELEFVVDGRKREDIVRFFLGALSRTELDSIGRVKDSMFLEAAHSMRLVEGVQGLLAALQEAEIRLAIATSARRKRAICMLDRFALRQYFSAVVTGDDVEKGKPDPSVFSMACRLLGVDPQHTVVFEDAASGVKGARAAGIRCIGIAQPDREGLLYAAGADYVLPNFTASAMDKIMRIFEAASA